MTDNVVQLKMDLPTARRRIKSLAANSANVFQAPKMKGVMRNRRITWEEVIKVLKNGVITEGPYLDVKGCWRCRVENFGAGRYINVAVVINSDHLLVITAFDKKRSS